MSVYVFAGWPTRMADDQAPATFLEIESAKVSEIETRTTVSEVLPDCRSRLVIAPEVSNVGITADSFSENHAFGNGVTCALVRFAGSDEPVQLSWIVTPRDTGKLSASDYRTLKAIIS